MTDLPPEPLPAVFTRMTEETRRVLFFARAEVSKWGSAAIEPEHLLLGITHEEKGATVALLREKFQLDMVSLIKDIRSQMERKPRFSTSIEVPFSASAEQVLIHTVEEADHLQQQEIEPEHLLLGLLRLTDSIPAAILSKHGVSLESVRERL